MSVATSPLSSLEQRDVSVADQIDTGDLADDEINKIYAVNAKPSHDEFFQKKDEGTLWERLRVRFPYYIPILYWMPQYKWKDDFVSDIVAGLGVAAMLIPQSLAYALLAGVPPMNGLYTAFFPLLTYFLLGTSKQLSVGPDALSSLLVGIILTEMDSTHPVTVLFPVLAFYSGLLLLIFGLLRVGFLDNVLSRPLLCGFVNAVALTILFEQFEPLFGLPHHANHGYHKVITWIQDIHLTNFETLGVGFICMSALFLNRFLKQRWRFFKYVPEPLLVVIVSIIVAYTTDLQSKGVRLLGSIGSGFEVPAAPLISLPTEKGQSSVFTDALLITIIGFIEHIVIAKLYSTKYNYPISPNRELVALGVSNMMGSFFHTYPTFGSLPRSAVADGLGAKSQIFCFVSAVVVGLTILFLGPLFFYLPRVAMSSIIIVASFGLFEFEDIIFLWETRSWKDLILTLFTFLMTIFLGIELGIFISIGISVFFVIKHTTYPTITILGRDEHGGFTEVCGDNVHIIPGIHLIRLEDSLFFANIAQIKSVFLRIERLGDPTAHPAEKREVPVTRAFVIHARNVLNMDASALQVLHEMVHEYQLRNVMICFVKVRDHLKKPMALAHVVGSFDDPSMLFETIEEAVDYVQRMLAAEPNSTDEGSDTDVIPLEPSSRSVEMSTFPNEDDHSPVHRRV